MAHVCNWEWDVPGDRMRWSDEVTRIVGHTTNEMIGDLDRMQRFVHPDDQTEVIRQTTNLLKHGTPTDMEHRIVRDDGTIRWIHSRAEATRGADGTPLLIFGTIVDITDRRESEEKLRRLNEELERRVAERTAELERLAAELQVTNKEIRHD
jgi:PAS domain S-box-containing protein